LNYFKYNMFYMCYSFPFTKKYITHYSYRYNAQLCGLGVEHFSLMIPSFLVFYTFISTVNQ